MRSQCSLYVDAGYLLASVATRTTGTALRSGIEVDFSVLIAGLTKQVENLSGLPLLRVNWYDASKGAEPDPEQKAIAALPRVKVRLGRVGFSGEQKGVDLRIGLDMVAHARNGAIDVILLVSGDDDLTEAVEEAQVHGVQVIVLAVPGRDGRPHGLSEHLRRAADGVEVCDVATLDQAVTKTQAKTQAVATPAPPVPGPVPRPPSGIPTPADLANGRLQATAPATPAPAGAAAPRPAEPASVLAYSTTTGLPSLVPVEFALPKEEVDKAIEEVVGRVVQSLLDSLTKEAQAEILEAWPSIPREVDRTLLLDLSNSLDYYDLSESIRYRLRGQFWKGFKEAAA
ncbi:MAG: NYN domain-containing protein [Bifidobacteriaceae bacterium]|jgi:uncharacterized LabA/DUF88 family protein|nr:NYN domain-containing protein [Bifidobacteriaceae bacterium]